MDDYVRFKLKYGDRWFDPQDLWCYSQEEDGHFDLIVYHPTYSQEFRNELANGTYLLLDMAIGEYDVMTGIRYIDHQQLPENPESSGLYRFKDLRRVFDTYKKNR